jgi:hypothetical protein
MRKSGNTEIALLRSKSAYHAKGYRENGEKRPERGTSVNWDMISQ